MNRQQRRQQSRSAGRGQAGPALGLALEHHRGGRLAEAEQLYRRVLQSEPRQADALHLLGVLADQQGDPVRAVDLIERAITIAPNVADYHLNLGNAHRRLGRLEAAVASYQHAASLAPAAAGPRNNLAAALLDLGQLEESAAAAQQAVQLDPNLFEAHNGLGNALQRLGRLAEAAASFEHALALAPGAAEVHHNLANLRQARGDAAGAAASASRAIELAPAWADPRVGLGNARRTLGDLPGAIASYREALALDPASAEAHSSLGAALQLVGQPDTAQAHFERAIELKPDLADAHSNLGTSLRARGDLAAALDCYQRALALDPDLAEAWSNLSNALLLQGDPEASLQAAQRAVQLDPTLPAAHNNLGNACRELGDLAGATSAYAQALSLLPSLVEAHTNLGNVQLARGELRAAAASYRRALTLRPTHVDAHDNLLVALLYDPDLAPADLLAEHRAWDNAHHQAAPPALLHPDHDRDPERPLRIGYLSPDFRQHPIASGFLPLLANHDRAQFEVVLYASSWQRDPMTERLANLADAWREVVGLDDAAAVELIRADQLDLLVDLACHTAGNRLGVLARRPAPLQLTHSLMTSGLSAIDYLIADRHLAPDLPPDALAEELIRLPDCYTCYAPPDEAPPVAPLPAARSGRITFGSFNNLAKLNPQVIALWSRLLQAVPTSRLLLKGSLRVDGPTRDRLHHRFAEHGLDPERVEVLERAATFAEHLDQYRLIDVALDPFPFNGCTTTLEALWMGVPVIALAGELFADRAGVTLLHSLGRPDLVAANPDDYVARATELASDLPALAATRANLRQQMAASPLCDGPRYARAIEAAYRTAWRRWCAAGES